MNNIEIETIEHKYLNKFYHFLKYTEDEMLFGFQTKEDIKNDWIDLYGNKNNNGKNSISDFTVGAERIVYSLFNGRAIGQPNSAPVGSDLFFEVNDAYIHIDLKTVQTKNIGDCTRNILVGENQNSYRGNMLVKNKKGQEPTTREYVPALPTFYNKNTDKEKICITYFITILYEKENLDILFIHISCMPNGALESYYKHRPLSPGKLTHEARFNYSEVNRFELIPDEPSRIKIVYFNENFMTEKDLKKLSFLKGIYEKQNEMK